MHGIPGYLNFLDSRYSLLLYVEFESESPAPPLSLNDLHMIAADIVNINVLVNTSVKTTGGSMSRGLP